MSKKITLIALVFSLTAGPVFAGPRGDRIADAATRSAARAEPTGEHMSDLQKKNLATLQSDLEAVKAGSEVTQEQKDALAKSLAAIPDGATKPSDEAVAALAGSLAEAKADGKMEPNEAKQLASDVMKVLESAGVPPEEVQAAMTDAKAVLEASGVDKADAELVASHLKRIADEIQKNVDLGKANVQEATGATGDSKAKRRRSR